MENLLGDVLLVLLSRNIQKACFEFAGLHLC